MKTLGVDILNGRESRGWSQAQLAKVAGISRSTIQNVERGDAISPRLAAVLAKALDLSVSEAIAATRQPTPTVVIRGNLAERLRGNARIAGKSVDDYLAALLPKPSTKGKR